MGTSKLLCRQTVNWLRNSVPGCQFYGTLWQECHFFKGTEAEAKELLLKISKTSDYRVAGWVKETIKNALMLAI